MQKNERAQELAYDWIRWLDSKRFMSPKLPPNFLTLLMEQSGGAGEPDGRMSKDMPAFNAAVMALIDHRPEMAFPFLKVYCGVPRNPVKSLAGDKGVSPRFYYDQAHKGAAEVVRRMNLVLSLNLLR